MCTRRQCELIRISLLVGESEHIPGVIILKCNRGNLFKRDYTVNIEGTVRNKTTLIVLSSLNGDFIQSIFRHRNIPLDPLSGHFPCLPADHVQLDLCGTVRLRCCGGAIISRIQ